LLGTRQNPYRSSGRAAHVMQLHGLNLQPINRNGNMQYFIQQDKLAEMPVFLSILL
jgi:hypothetical protein